MIDDHGTGGLTNLDAPPTEISPPLEPPIDDTIAQEPHPKRRRNRIIEWVLVIVVAAVIALGVRSFGIETFYVPSGSMLPTLQLGDRILVDKLFFSPGSVRRGDIVVFRRVPNDHDPSRPGDLVKRVIGLPGDVISSRGNTVYIGDKALSEPWLPKLVGQCAESALDIHRTVIPKGRYFMMGDCRGISYDSRAWGTVPSSYLVGKVFVVVWRHSHPWLHWF